MSYNYQYQRESDRDGNQYRKEQYSSNRNDDRDNQQSYRTQQVHSSRDFDNNRDNWNKDSNTRYQQYSSSNRDWKGDADDSYMRQIYSRNQNQGQGYNRDRVDRDRDGDDLRTERKYYWQQTKTFHDDPTQNERSSNLYGNRNELSYGGSPQQYNQNWQQSRQWDQCNQDQCNRGGCSWGNKECNRSQWHGRNECARGGQQGQQQYGYDNRNEYSRRYETDGTQQRNYQSQGRWQDQSSRF
ncbi:bifunctional endo-1,4-beta-xylanase XylA-like [Paramacrobiotus metropolitanus]|uniref:bifunctional endo-1,4-beta-xylanase XylA-like n=1 Tax=Paramacrobiotus metropolitanus TaxID=2943436 RepID=UPI0024456D37|nr:bifunctional endo-1,4-beta-xylanase XylA-like [Paramacrobiotus metropolitanus]